jgi:uncharacterized protein (TIGR03790 family)
VNLHRRFFWLALVIVTLCASHPALALQPDEIVLITNKNAPDGQKLATLYCQLRNVPADHVIALDIPAATEMAFDTYETAVVAPVRQFLQDHQLQKTTKCLVTFYGVPLRIRAKQNTPAEEIELDSLRKVQADAIDKVKQTAMQMESQAAELDQTFKPGVGDSIEVWLARAQAANEVISRQIRAITDPTERDKQTHRILASLEALGGLGEIDSRLGETLRTEPNESDEQRQRWIDLHANILQARELTREFQSRRWDSDARAQLLHISQERFGLVGTLRITEAEIDYLTTDATASALDSELALLWWDYYPHGHWMPNPLQYSFAGKSPTTLMVMRLDGPDSATVEKLMRTSVEVEKTGLNGIIAIDSRGLQPIDAKGNPDQYGQFDETLRHLAYLVRTRTNLKIRLDEQDVVFPPHSVKDVALYCGWYSVSRYIPGCDFNPGAIGYHIASFELVSLHEPSSYWVRGLLLDGVVGTLGPVAEPYLQAFPKPDEFFPLLLTGKLTLAEVYWKTTPMTSWMISFIGDPLYTPYKMDPAMKVEDLPAPLQRAFEVPQNPTGQ